MHLLARSMLCTAIMGRRSKSCVPGARLPGGANPPPPAAPLPPAGAAPTMPGGDSPVPDIFHSICWMPGMAARGDVAALAV
jgi:hypothetical protein